MKKVLLLISFLMITFSAAWAVTGLNPYAYKLEFGGQTDNNRKMILKYWLNAPAESVSIEVTYMDGSTPRVATFTGGTANEGENSIEVSTIGLPARVPLSWSVTVNKTSNIEPIQISQSYNFYCPQGVAVDKDPKSNNFGRILVTETLQGRKGTKDYVSTVSNGSAVQAGLYAFDAQFNQINSKGVPYKGGKTFTQQMTHSSLDGGHQPYQVKISEDGRIFISCADLRSHGVVVWEAVDKDNLNTTWKALIRNGEEGVWDKTNYQLYDANKKFYAGFNCSMDVKGSGGDLKILLYSANYSGVHSFDPKGYRLDEYAIGTYSGNDFTGTIKNIWAPGAKKYGIVYDNAKVIYDGQGGYWFGASREGGTETNLAHINKNGTQDQYETTKTLFGGSGIMVHTTTYEPNAGQRWMFKGLDRESASNGKFGIWNITTDANGTTSRDRIYTVTSTGLGRNHNDFAVDYAENLFVVGNNGEKIVAFALPYSGTKTTPATTTFTLEGQLNPFAYNLYTTIDPQTDSISLHFFLNAPAQQVRVLLIDENDQEHLLRTYPSAGSGKNYVENHPNGYKTIITRDDVTSLGLPLNGTFRWQVEVDGNSVAAPTELPMSYGFYHPSSVDIDNNPENESFGLIIANEAMHKVTQMTGATVGSAGIPYSEYASYKTGAGIYAFTPAFEAIKNGSNYGFNGGNQFDELNAAGVSTGSTTAAAYAPRRVRFSEDGRLFVTSLNPITNENKDRNAYLWEVSPNALDSWTPVFQEFTIGDSAKLTIGD